MSKQAASGQRSTASGTSPVHTPDAIARAHGVVELLRSSADRIEAARALPADIVAALHEARLFRLLLPRSLGGDELHLKALAQVMEVIGGADASTAWCMGQGGGCAMSAAYLKPEVARRLFGPADAVLAWGAGPQGKATAVDGGYRVTGKWSFASGCANATLLGGHSRVFEKDGTPRKRADGSHLERSMLFVKSKATIHDMWYTLGLRGTASYTYEVQDLFVPEEETVDRDAPNEVVEQGTLYLFPDTYAYASSFSALMLGVAQSMVRDLKNFGHDQIAARGGILAQGEPRLPVAVRRARSSVARVPRLSAQHARRALGQGRSDARVRPGGARQPEARFDARHQSGG